ncbi:MAG: lipoate--protein ligase family protein [Anaerolineae bacterium]|nr:lipoate--protein ligase family protein [Anaerolineae bacterium]
MKSDYPHATWRLIFHGEAPGALNMAIDEAMLIALAEGVSPPTLRFYGWAPPCLSLGRNQPVTDADLPVCRAAGIDLVRRPTGGRAILHTDELTYSVTLTASDPRAAGSVVEGYRRLSEGLLAGLRRLGVEAIQARGQRKPASGLTAICFDTPSDYEITAGGRKLVGSAQWRSRGRVLQHGTLPLHGDITRVVSYLSMPDGERETQRRALGASALTLEEALGHTLPFAQVAQALADGFAQALNVTLIPGDLADYERTLTDDLRWRYAALNRPAQPES